MGNRDDVPEGLNDVVAIDAGDFYTVALTQAGLVYAWGYNDRGQCDVPEGLNNVVGIAADRSHALALQADGTVVAWGNNNYGECNVPARLNLTGGLADFAVSRGTLSKKFAPNTLEYTLYVKKKVPNIDFTATLENSEHMLLLNGYPQMSGMTKQIDLNEKTNDFQIVVSEGALLRTYQVTVEKTGFFKLFIIRIKSFLLSLFSF